MLMKIVIGIQFSDDSDVTENCLIPQLPPQTLLGVSPSSGRQCYGPQQTQSGCHRPFEGSHRGVRGTATSFFFFYAKHHLNEPLHLYVPSCNCAVPLTADSAESGDWAGRRLPVIPLTIQQCFSRLKINWWRYKFIQFHIRLCLMNSLT